MTGVGDGGDGRFSALNARSIPRDGMGICILRWDASARRDSLTMTDIFPDTTNSSIPVLALWQNSTIWCELTNAPASFL